jgi:iron complex transport system substrate-binding protein
MVLVAPCGYGLERAAELAKTIPHIPGATTFAVDANAYFARPGPRVAEGVELLAHLFHPQRCDWAGDGQPWRQIVSLR